MNIVFMGTPDFAVESLKKLKESKHNILFVISQPDRPKGRGMKFIPSPVKQYALENDIPVYTTEKINNDKELIDSIKNLNPDLILVVAFGQIVSKEILDIPKYGCINVHGSLLPKYRGAAPIQWSIINGDKETGVTTMFMDVGMDTGDILLTKKVTIDKNETSGELFDRLAPIGGDLLLETIDKLEEGSLTRTKQGDDFTIAPMISKEMCLIDWENCNALQIKNLVRGLSPNLGAKYIVNDVTYKIWKVDVVSFDEIEIDSASYKNGEIVLEDSKIGLYIKAKDGIISVLEIQGLNGKKMNIKDFLRGNKINIVK